MQQLKKPSTNKYATSRVLLGLFFIGAGLFALVSGTTSFSLAAVDFFQFKNIVGLVLIVFGALVFVRAFARY